MSANDSQFAATVQKFNKYMGDLISSDREAAAFVMALDDLEKAKTPEMVPTVQPSFALHNTKRRPQQGRNRSKRPRPTSHRHPAGGSSRNTKNENRRLEFMSCMMLSPAHIATVAHGLATCSINPNVPASAAGELRDALGACRYPHDFLYDDRRIYPVLYRHNEAAYEGAIRQSRTKPTKCQPCRTMCRTCCTVWTYNEHYFLDADFFKISVLPDCYIYQCEETGHGRHEFTESACKDFKPLVRIRRPAECSIHAARGASDPRRIP